MRWFLDQYFEKSGDFYARNGIFLHQNYAKTQYLQQHSDFCIKITRKSRDFFISELRKTTFSLKN